MASFPIHTLFEPARRTKNIHLWNMIPGWLQEINFTDNFSVYKKKKKGS